MLHSRTTRNILPGPFEAFERGDYLSAARQISPDHWQHWASLAALGRTAGTTDALVRFEQPDARFHAGVAAWMEGDDERAIALLRQAPGEHAANLAGLIARRPVTALTQLPWNRGGSWDVVGELRDPSFRLLNVSFHPGDVQNRPYANIHDLVPAGVQPDFFLTEMLEWHLIAPNVRELGCPVIGHSSDYDIHIQAVAPWLAVFDELLVLDSVQWRDMSALAPHAHVSVFPKVFGVPRRVPAFQHGGERAVDVFLSGTVVHPFHPDKDAIVLQLVEPRDIRLRMVNGFDPADGYYRSLANAKICANYVRHPGGLPTRGLEGLAMGCVITVQEENVLHLFFDRSTGVVPYGRESRGLVDAVRDILRHWSTYEAAAARGAARVREEFDLSRVASQYLRFATVVAARPRPYRAGPDPSSLIQKRAVVHKGWLPSYQFGGTLLTGWAACSVERMRARCDAAESPGLLNDIAREHLLASYHRVPADTWLPAVIVPLARAVASFPAALVPRLNLIRVLLHFGSGGEVGRGIALLDDTLSRPPAFWDVDPLDDVLPWDFCPSFFDYRRYFDCVTAALGGDGPARTNLTPIILAALHYYRGRYARQVAGAVAELEYAARAVELDPAFAEYVLYYCRLLIDRGLDADLHRAAELLRTLASRSARFLEIADLTRQLPPERLGEWHNDLSEKAARFWAATEMRENLPEPWLQPVQR